MASFYPGFYLPPLVQSAQDSLPDVTSWVMWVHVSKVPWPFLEQAAPLLPAVPNYARP